MTCAEEAVSAYRANRENGAIQDNPNAEFPQDGKYSWTQPNSGCSSVTYTEEIKDRTWMEEKDRNYLNRLKRGKTLTQTEEIDTTTQHDEVNTISISEKMGNQFFTPPIDKNDFTKRQLLTEDHTTCREKGEEGEENDTPNISFPTAIPQ